MSGSDKMEVDDGPPPVVVVDQGQDGSLVLSRSGSPVRAPAPVCGRLHTLVERGPHGPSLETVEHGLLYARCQRMRIFESKIHSRDASAQCPAEFCGCVL